MEKNNKLELKEILHKISLTSNEFKNLLQEKRNLREYFHWLYRQQFHDRVPKNKYLFIKDKLIETLENASLKPIEIRLEIATLTSVYLRDIINEDVNINDCLLDLINNGNFNHLDKIKTESTYTFRPIANIIFDLDGESSSLKILIATSVIFGLSLDRYEEYLQGQEDEDTDLPSSNSLKNETHDSKKLIAGKNLWIKLIWCGVGIGILISIIAIIVAFNSNYKQQDLAKKSTSDFYFLSENVFKSQTDNLLGASDKVELKVISIIPDKGVLALELINHKDQALIPEGLFLIIDQIVPKISHSRMLYNPKPDYIIEMSMQTSENYKAFLNNNFKIEPQTLNTLHLGINALPLLRGHAVTLQIEFIYYDMNGITHPVKTDSFVLNF